MTQQTAPFIEGKFGWALGESNWNLGMDENLLKFSYLFDRNIDGIVASLPVPVNGEAYFNTTDNRIYYVVNGVFSSTPTPKWFEVTLRSSGVVYQFDGSALVLGNTFKNDLANNSDPIKGAGMVGYSGRTVGEALDLLTRGFVYAKDFGIVGSTTGNLIDETAKFITACDDCRTKGLNLNTGTLKIYLPTLATPISLDDFLVFGEGDTLYTPMDDWGVPRGLNDASLYLIPDALTQKCSVLIHTGFDGPLFTGKQFNARNLGILGKFSGAANCAFVQSTPTTYPGWSQGVQYTDKVSIAYTGSHGIHLKGGLELIKDYWPLIRTKYCGGHGLLIDTTVGIDCPVEYFNIDKGGFGSSRLANIRIKGVRKAVDIGAVTLNDPGMLRLIPGGAVPGTVAPTTEDLMVPGVQIDLDGIAAPFDVHLDGVIAEYCNLIVKTTGNYTSGLVVENTIQYPVYSPGWQWRTGLMTHTTSANSTLRNNGGNTSGAVFSYRNHTATDVKVGTDGYTTLYGLTPSRTRVPLEFDPRSGTIGTGSAGTFTSNLVAALETPASNSAALSEVFSVVSNFQGVGSNGAGAYLLLVIRGVDGTYVGMTVALSSTTGFTAPPTVDTAGVISIPLAANYRARVTRLDHGALSTVAVAAP